MATYGARLSARRWGCKCFHAVAGPRFRRLRRAVADHRQRSHLWHSGNIPTARPRVPVLRVVGLAARTGLVLRGIGFATLSVYRPLVQRASLG